MGQPYNAYEDYRHSKAKDPAISFDQHLMNTIEEEIAKEDLDRVRNTYNIIQVLNKDKLFSRLSNKVLIVFLRSRLLLDDQDSELQNAINKMASN